MDVNMRRTQLNLFNILCAVLCLLLLFFKTTTSSRLNTNELKQKPATHSFAALNAKFQMPHNSFQQHEQRLPHLKALLTTVDRMPLAMETRSQRIVVLRQANAINRRARPVRASNDNEVAVNIDDNYYDADNDNRDTDVNENKLLSNGSLQRLRRAADEPEKENEGGVIQWLSDNIGPIMNLFSALNAEFQAPQNNFQHGVQRLQPFKALLTTMNHMPLAGEPRSEHIVALKPANAVNRRIRLARAISENDDDNIEVVEVEKQNEGGVAKWINENLGQLVDLVTRLAVIIMDLFN